MSEGTPSNEALKRDGEAAFAYVTETRRYLPSQVVHCGLSLETGVASSLAVSHDCAAVVLMSPYTSVSKIARKHVPHLKIYPEWMFPQPDLGSDVLASKPLLPVLAVHGELDPLLPISGAEQVLSRLKGIKRFVRIPGGNHIGGISGDPSDANTGGGIVKEFLQSL